MLKSSVDPAYLFKSLGLEILRETPKELRTKCVIHGGDNETSFRFNKERRTWVCFSQKCHDVYGNDILGLIMGVLRMDFAQAVEYLRSLVGDIGDIDSKYALFKRTRERDNFIKLYSDAHEKPWYVNENSLSEVYLGRRSTYFNNEGFSDKTLDFFEIGGGWQDDRGEIRDVIPIRDENGVLLAYSLSALNREVSHDDKYKHTSGFDKDSCLYNLHRAKYFVGRSPLVLVEGFKSVWRLHDYGIHNVAAVMGSSLTPGQIYLLLVHALNGVVLFFDNDAAGVKGMTKAYEDLHSKIKVRPVFIQETDDNGKGLDPADLTKAQVYGYLKFFT